MAVSTGPRWIDDMIARPSAALPESRFAVRGTKLGDLGRTEMLPYLSFSKLREYACRSKINLCITRRAHASVYGSSSSRPFELSSMGACIVANPYEGLELWFEPEKEIIVVNSHEEALDRYRYLLDARQPNGKKWARPPASVSWPNTPCATAPTNWPTLCAAMPDVQHIQDRAYR